MNANIARQLVTSSIGNTPLAGFTLKATEEGYEVSDGNAFEMFEFGQEVEALNAYADFIDTFIGDDADYDYTDWIAARDQARTDAEAL